MWWTLEEEKSITPSFIQISRDVPGEITFTVTSEVSPRPAGPTQRKRTRAEALERIESLPDLSFGLSAASSSIPAVAAVGRAVFRPVLIYEASKIGATALIYADPFNRLE